MTGYDYADRHDGRAWAVVFRAARHVLNDHGWGPVPGPFDRARTDAVFFLADLSRALCATSYEAALPSDWREIRPSAEHVWTYPKGADLLRIRLETSLKADAAEAILFCALAFGLIIGGAALHDVITRSYGDCDAADLARGARMLLAMGPAIAALAALALWGPGPNGHRRVEAFAGGGFYWARLYGWGLYAKDARRHGETFTERTGGKRRVKIGRWSIGGLKP